MKISAVIISFNEEKNIAKAIESVKVFADEVVVVDSESTDGTRQIAGELGAKVTTQPWLGFSKQKQFAVDIAENDWIFSLDADEVVSDELRAEVLRIKDSAPAADGFRVPRLAFYMGRAIRHSGWYPDRQLRFFDRRKGRWNSRVIHESVEMDGGAKILNLRSDILHYSIKDAAEHANMIGERYAPLAALQMRNEGRRGSIAKMVVSGPAAFLRAYLLKLGFLDGLAGYTIAKFAAHHAFLKHLLLWELERTRENEEQGFGR